MAERIAPGAAWRGTGNAARAGTDRLLPAARRGVSLSSDCLDRKPGHPARAGGCRAIRRQGRARWPCLGLQPYRPPSRDRSLPDTRADRTAKKDALRRCITTRGHRHVRVRQRADRYAHCAPMQGEMYRSDAGRVSAPAVGSGARRRLFAPGTRVPLPRDRAKGEGYLRTASRIAWAGVAEWQTRQTQNLLSVRTWGFKSLHPHQLDQWLTGERRSKPDTVNQNCPQDVRNC